MAPEAKDNPAGAPRAGAPTAASCSLCGSTGAEPKFTAGGCNLVECSRCGLHYFLLSGRETGRSDAMPAQRRRLYEALYYDRWFARIARHIPEAGNFLDIGCGTGRLLELLRDRPALRRAGVEPQSSRAHLAAQAGACPVHEGTLATFVPPGPLDAVTMINVFSHVPDLAGLLASLSRMLAPGGRLIVQTGVLNPDVRPDSVGDWGIPDDRQFMGPRTPQYIAGEFGLKLIEWLKVPYATDFCSPQNLRTPGRTPLRRAAKRFLSLVPGSCRMLARLYELRHGRGVWSSLIVFEKP